MVFKIDVGRKLIMKTKIIGFLICMLLIFTIVLSASSISMIPRKIKPFSNGETLYVGGSGPGNYTKLQDAIDNASDGDTVFVYNGTYYENIVVNKTIDLIGVDKNTAIIIGDNDYNVIEINAPNVVVKYFMVIGGGHCIDIDSDYSEISNNIFKDSGYAAIEVNGDFNVISENSVSGNISNPEGHGIELRHSYNTSQYNIVKNNIIKDCYYGIDIVESFGNSQCSNNEIFGNTITDCLIGIYIN